MNYILSLGFIMLLSGCTTIVAPVTEYRIITKAPTSTQSSRACRDKSLKIAQAFSSSSLMSQNMNYAQGRTKQFAYSQAQWAESPNLGITSELLKHIRATNFFKSVQSSKSRSKNDLILEINIEDFMQYFSEDSTSSHANVSIELTLLDTKTNVVVATRTFVSKVDSETLDANGGVEALSLALQNVLNQTKEWLGGVCK
ncbi:MAG: ABC-type transport auxiliary lipoprotein family protein [Campylobacterota bacterium]|nr:ABC-type transport auxiliary lipoprotein family protein [Campylobacterota bacterium]